MHAHRHALAALLALAATATAAPAALAAPRDGQILDQKPYPFPEYDALPPWARARYTPAGYDELRRSPELELVRLTYASDGLKVVGFLWKPKRPAGKLPVLIWSRGGIGEDAKIGDAN